MAAEATTVDGAHHPVGAGVSPQHDQPIRSAGWARRGDRAAPWLVGGICLFLRLATAATGPTDWDSAQYAAGVLRFDITHGRPQPPGYWLTVMAGRALHVVTGLGVIRSLVLVSAAASAVAAGMVVMAGRDLGGRDLGGRDLGGRWVGLAAGLLVVTSPFAWFSGSIVSTYSFDLLAAPILMVLAWRARPHSWHGMAALGVLGILAGFRPSILQAFAVLALIAVVASVRTVGEGLRCLAVGLAAVMVWWLPMVSMQPGGATAWLRATQSEASGAAHLTSVLLGASQANVNVGTFAATTIVALAPVLFVTIVAALALGIRWSYRTLRTAPEEGSTPVSMHEDTDGSSADPGGHRWLQHRATILAAATIPPMAVVALIQFAKSGYVLAYLPGAIIVLLLVPARLVRATPSPSRGPDSTDRSENSSYSIHERRPRTALAWLGFVSLLAALAAVVGAQRFLAGPGVLPPALAKPDQLWLTQPRYQAPYPATRFTIRNADAADLGLAALGPLIRADRDVVALDTVDGGTSLYRNAGWALPQDRVSLIEPGDVPYNQLHRSLFYTGGTTLAVAPGGSLYLIASPALPDLFRLTGTGAAGQVRSAPRIGGYLVFRIKPGSTILGVTVVAHAGPRPLGHGL